MSDFEKELHAMFDNIWDCEIDHPLFQDTVGELMEAVIQAHEKHNLTHGTNLAEVGTDRISRQQAINDVESWVAVDGHERKLQRNVIEWLKNFPSATDNNVGTKIEPLTDKEQRIFLAAIERERKVCKEVDDQYTHEPYEVLLTKVCGEIERKVKKALWS